MARVSESEKQRIRQSILVVAKKHFEDKGYDNTKTKDIANEVGIAEGTLFNYFDTKTEIFLEAMAGGYIVDKNALDSLNYKDEIVDIIYELIYKPIKGFIKMPRRIIKEIATAGVRTAQKKPDLIKKVIQLDYDMIDDLEKVFTKLIYEKRMREIDAKMLAEIVYSIAVVEMVVYVYEEKITVNKMLENLKQKIEFVVEGHIL